MDLPSPAHGPHWTGAVLILGVQLLGKELFCCFPLGTPQVSLGFALLVAEFPTPRSQCLQNSGPCFGGCSGLILLSYTG